MRRQAAIALQAKVKRYLCTFLPWLVFPQKGATHAAHWDAHSSEPFSKPDPAGLAMMQEILERVPDREAAILDMGCNVGRHMNYLHQQGYRNLHGVDFSSRALRDMATTFPELHAVARVTAASFQDYLTRDLAEMDVVFTYGATFELVHPTFPLVRRICRIARRYVMLVISESGHAYPRLWEYEFAKEGFELTLLRRPASAAVPRQTASLLVFKRLGT